MRGDLDKRVHDLQRRGYRVVSRGTRVAVLTRAANHSPGLADLLTVVGTVALGLFGLWRSSWAFALVGLIGTCLALAAWWLRGRSITVRLTHDTSGRVREELLKAGH